MSVPFCPNYSVHTILSNTILSVYHFYHFVHTILSIPLGVRYYFVRSPLRDCDVLLCLRQIRRLVVSKQSEWKAMEWWLVSSFIISRSLRGGDYGASETSSIFGKGVPKSWYQLLISCIGNRNASSSGVDRWLIGIAILIGVGQFRNWNDVGPKLTAVKKIKR